MRTDLAYINDTMEMEVAAEERGERKSIQSEPRPVTRIKGFAMPEEVTRPLEEAGYAALRKDVVGKYRKNAADLRVKLMVAGITPLAVIPHKAWHALCQASGLYLLSPDPQNRVQLLTDKIDELRRSYEGPEWLIGALCMALGAALVCWIGVLLGWWYEFGVIGIPFAALGVGIFGLHAGHDLSAKVIGERRFRRRVACYLAGKTWGQILHDLAPTHRLWDGQLSVEVDLPAPPIEVARIIMQAQRASFHLQVAAEAGAISLRGGVDELFVKGYAELLAREEAIRRDPIIFVESTSENYYGYHYRQDEDAVAILAQFGDFPIEKEVVDRVVAGRSVI